MSEMKPHLTREMPAGVMIGHYKVGRKLGEGGMGVVFVADDTRLRRTVALKVLHGDVTNDADRRYRFLREGRLAAGLTHPCIATVFEVGEADERLFIAMELVEGRHVGALLEESEHGYLKIFQALRIAREVVRGLVKAHEAGIIHRDLKPENVMYGEDQVVKILDFGVAKRTDDTSAEVTAHETKQGSLVGTPAYMSPEQAAGRALDARSDIFSVGVMLYEMLTGQRPFQGETWQEIIISIARDPLVPASTHRPEISPPIDRVLGLCLAKKADARFPNARALLDELELLLLDAASGQNASDTLEAISRIVSGPRSVALPPMSQDANAVRVSVAAAKTELAIASESPRDESANPPRRRSWLPLISLGSAGLAGVVAFFAFSKGSTHPSPAPSSTAAVASAVEGTNPAASPGRPAAVPSSAPEPSAAASAAPTATAIQAGAPGLRSTATASPLAPPRGAPTSAPAQAAPKSNKTNPVLGF